MKKPYKLWGGVINCYYIAFVLWGGSLAYKASPTWSHLRVFCGENTGLYHPLDSYKRIIIIAAEHAFLRSMSLANMAIGPQCSSLCFFNVDIAYPPWAEKCSLQESTIHTVWVIQIVTECMPIRGWLIYFSDSAMKGFCCQMHIMCWKSAMTSTQKWVGRACSLSHSLCTNMTGLQSTGSLVLWIDCLSMREMLVLHLFCFFFFFPRGAEYAVMKQTICNW